MKAHKGLWNRDFTLLMSGHMASNLGNSIYLIVMLIYVQQTTGSPLMVGIVQASVFLPVMLLAVRGGRTADHISKRTILVLSDSLRGAAMLLLAAGIVLFPDYGLEIAVSASVIIGIGSAYFTPAVQSLIPLLADRSHLQSANALRIGSLLGTAIAGNILGSTLFSVLGTAWVLVINGISFLVSAWSESMITQPGTPERTAETASKNKIALKSGERCYIMMYVLFTAVYPAVVTAMPFYVIGVIQASEIWLGILVAWGFLGSLAGFIALYFLKGIPDAAKLRLGCSIAAISLAVLGWTPFPEGAAALAAASGCLFAFGMSGSFVFLTVTTGLQIYTAPQRRGQVFGKLEARSAAAAPLGYIIGGAALQFGSITLTLLMLSAILMLTALPAGPWARRVCSDRI